MQNKTGTEIIGHYSYCGWMVFIIIAMSSLEQVAFIFFLDPLEVFTNVPIVYKSLGIIVIINLKDISVYETKI